MQPVALQQSRTAQIEALTAEPLDVLVVGGGILGAGIARDAAMRGLRVGLVEQHDLAFGTSSRSSRLLHGGLRYLAQGRIGLVREGSREKRLLARIAPHLAEPLPFIFPTYRRTGWPLWQLRIGVRIYDLLCGGQNLGPSGSLSRSEMLERLPGINPQNLTGGVRYFDGLTNDSRLVLDTLRSAGRHGAVICNYTRLENASSRPNGWDCELLDVLADRPCRLLARSVVNAAGPWADKLPHSRVCLRLTKGVHLVIDRRRLPLPSAGDPESGTERAEAVVMTQGRRILFAIPWGERVILGTTDTDYDGPIEAVRTEPADVEYILGVVNAAFPAAGLGRVALNPADVISHWAGLRPLIASRRGGPSDISRAHQVRMSVCRGHTGPGWLDVAGGKLTTYRLIAEQAVDRLLRHLRREATPCCTAEEPLLPAGEAEGLSGILPPPVTPQVVEHCCRNEWAVHLEDVMLRRTSWHFYLTDAGQVARQVAGWMAEIFAWDPPQQEAELARYRQITG
ncbi:MAG: glycerol-3-phosphate dehydrogenase/oxidase [Planctomycetota bacterium]|jgi:glycerol-3-phosphate dehydrogenase